MADPACSDPSCAYRIEVERRTLEAEGRVSELEAALAAVFRLLPAARVATAQRVLNAMAPSHAVTKGDEAK